MGVLAVMGMENPDFKVLGCEFPKVSRIKWSSTQSKIPPSEKTLKLRSSVYWEVRVPVKRTVQWEEGGQTVVELTVGIVETTTEEGGANTDVGQVDCVKEDSTVQGHDDIARMARKYGEGIVFL